MGIQYFHSAEAVRQTSDAYNSVTPEALAAAVEKIRPEFELQDFEAMPAVIIEKFQTIRSELLVVANNNWAMVAGMF